MDCTDVEFWEQRYRADRMPWDLHAVPPALKRYLQSGDAVKGRVLIPGCGSGYEVTAFRAHGIEPVAVDFSPAAVERARAVLGAAGECVRQADFFADDFGSDFDAVYERTFLCSLPPERWADYARRVHALLRPGGVLFGIFIYGVESEPPPFPLGSQEEAKRLLGAFELERDAPIPAAEMLPLYAGMERWQVWRAR